MLQKKLGESLTARIFLITVVILLFAGAVTFGLIAFATPVTYTSVINEDLTRQVSALVSRLADTKLEESGPLLDDFILASGASVMVFGPDGQPADTGSQLVSQLLYSDESTLVTSSGEDDVGTVQATDTGENAVSVAITMSEQASVTAEVHFAGRAEAYSLYVAPRMQAENLAVRALIQMAPYLLLVLLAFSLLCAFLYSRYITRPIVSLSGIAGKMAELDFNWECGDQRRDEIGTLGRSLNRMSRRLSAALTELEAANHSLRSKVEQERELDRQRMAFFSAASHELKTPLTILKGQLSGMLEGIGVYRDRDKYLLRSLQVTGRMEALIRELLDISRMEGGNVPIAKSEVDLQPLIREQLTLHSGLFEQRAQRVISSLDSGATVIGDTSLLGKAVGNLLSNASLYSPEGAEIRVWCGLLNVFPALTVENTGAHIQDSALPHLFEAFYREENSRNRSTGGSGLGLYLVRMILERHGAECRIENAPDCVRTSVVFRK